MDKEEREAKQKEAEQIAELNKRLNERRKEIGITPTRNIGYFKNFSNDIEENTAKDTEITHIVKSEVEENITKDTEITKSDIEENATKDSEITNIAKSDIEESPTDKSPTDKNVNDIVESKEQEKEKKKNNVLAFSKKNGRNDVKNAFIIEPLKMYKDKGVYKTERFYQSPKQITDFLIMWGKYKHTLPLYIIFFDLWKHSKFKDIKGEKCFKFSYKKLCDKFNIVEPKPLQNAIKELVELNLIKIEQKKKGSPNTYYLIFEEIKKEKK